MDWLLLESNVNIVTIVELVDLLYPNVKIVDWLYNMESKVSGLTYLWNLTLVAWLYPKFKLVEWLYMESKVSGFDYTFNLMLVDWLFIELKVSELNIYGV